MVLINQNNGLNLFITLLEHRYHENTAIACTNNEARMVWWSIDHMLFDLLIWQEKLELMFVIDILDN